MKLSQKIMRMGFLPSGDRYLIYPAGIPMTVTDDLAGFGQYVDRTEWMVEKAVDQTGFAAIDLSDKGENKWPVQTLLMSLIRLHLVEIDS